MSTSVTRVPARLIAALAALAMVASMVAIAPAISAQENDEGPEIVRVDGANRFDTAAQVAALTYEDGASDVIVAAGFNFPDALAASGVGGLVDAPILLVNDVLDTVPAETASALEDLDPDTVHIAGGPVAVSEAIEDEIADAGDWDMNRFAGADRFETAALMADVFEPEDVAGSTAIVGTGFVAADSLSAGPLAHFGPHPILLSNTDSLPEATADALEDLEIETVLVLGGVNAISEAVADEIEALDSVETVARAAGANRFETAVEITEFEEFSGGERVMLATGFGPDNVPADALAGGPHGGVFGAELLPINDVRDELPEAIAEYLQSIAEDLELIVVLGGEAAVSADVAAAAQAAGTFVPDEFTFTYLDGPDVLETDEERGDLEDNENILVLSDGTAVSTFQFSVPEDDFFVENNPVSFAVFAAALETGATLEVEETVEGFAHNLIEAELVLEGVVGNGDPGETGFAIVDAPSGFVLQEVTSDIFAGSGANEYTVDGEDVTQAEFLDNISVGDNLQAEVLVVGDDDTNFSDYIFSHNLTNAELDGAIASIDDTAADESITVDVNPDDSGDPTAVESTVDVGIIPAYVIDDLLGSDEYELTIDGDDVTVADFAAVVGELEGGENGALAYDRATDEDDDSVASFDFDSTDAVTVSQGVVDGVAANDVSFFAGNNMPNDPFDADADADLIRVDGVTVTAGDLDNVLSAGDVATLTEEFDDDTILEFETADITGDVTDVTGTNVTIELDDILDDDVDVTVTPFNYSTGTIQYFIDDVQRNQSQFLSELDTLVDDDEDVVLDVVDTGTRAQFRATTN